MCVVGHAGTTVALEADSAQVSVARRFVRRTLADLVPERVAGDLQLIVSELFTNAIEHGAADVVNVTVEVDVTEAGVTVESSGPAPGVGPIETWEVAAEEAITGRGLGIVRELADMVRVQRDPTRLVVSAYRSFTPIDA